MNVQKPWVVLETVPFPYEFELTGSRFFGNFTYWSDWDFFCQDSPQIREWLQSQGFVVNSGSYGPHPLDENTAVVATLPALESRNSVQIQLCHDVNKKRLAQNLLSHITGHWDKSQAPQFWKLAYKAVDMMAQIQGGGNNQ